MGNNESLPPPPPPSGPPNLPPTAPPGPPAYQPPPPPSYTPPTEQFPPTQQIPTAPVPGAPDLYPPTQQFPPTQAFPGGPPGGFPPDGTTGFEQPAEPPKKKTGLMIAAGLAAVAAIVAGIVVLTGGDDEKTVTPETTVSISIPEITIPELTIPEITFPEITLPAVTEPETTEPEVTEPEVTEPAVTTTIVSGGVITDDLGVFTIVLPDGLAVDTTPITTQDGFVLASIAGAVDLNGFYGDDVTPGMTSFVVREDVQSTPEEVLAFLEPVDGVCTGREQTDRYATAIGASILLKLDGCGDGTASKVILVAAIEGSTSIVALYVQGPGASADLLPQAQPVFESILLL